MENNLIPITLLSILILLAFNRYMILTSRMALQERQILSKKIGKYIDNNDKVSHQLKDRLILLHHLSMTSSLLMKVIIASFKSNKKSNVKIHGISKKENEFYQSCLRDLVKINFLYSPIQYLIVGFIAFIIAIVMLILAIVSSKLIGGFNSVDKVLNRDINSYLTRFDLNRI